MKWGKAGYEEEKLMIYDLEYNNENS